MTRYEVVIRGHLTPALQCAFDDFELTTRDANTVLRGEVPDQAALQGLLDRVLRLGLQLVDVHADA